MATDRVHGHERATNTAVLIARTRSSTCVHGPYAAVETARVHSRVHNRVHGRVRDVYTDSVHGRVYGSGRLRAMNTVEYTAVYEP